MMLLSYLEMTFYPMVLHYSGNNKVHLLDEIVWVTEASEITNHIISFIDFNQYLQGTY